MHRIALNFKFYCIVLPCVQLFVKIVESWNLKQHTARTRHSWTKLYLDFLNYFHFFKLYQLFVWFEEMYHLLLNITASVFFLKDVKLLIFATLTDFRSGGRCFSYKVSFVLWQQPKHVFFNNFIYLTFLAIIFFILQIDLMWMWFCTTWFEGSTENAFLCTNL